MNRVEQATHYDRMWTIGHIWRPDVWPEWSIIAPALVDCPGRLEIGAGLRPRLPVAGTWFADVSGVALRRLAERGGLPILASATALPFSDGSLDVVAACEILEHLADDESAFREIGRVLCPGGMFFLSVPLQPELWTAHDMLAGHFRRYEPARLAAQLAEAGFVVTAFCPSAAGGYTAFKAIGAWTFRRFPTASMWLEDRIIMPLAGAPNTRSSRPYPRSPPIVMRRARSSPAAESLTGDKISQATHIKRI